MIDPASASETRDSRSDGRSPHPEFGGGDFSHSPERNRRRAGLNILMVLGALAGVAALVLWVDVANQHDAEDISTPLWIAAIATSVAGGVIGLVWYARWAAALRAYQDRIENQKKAMALEKRDKEVPAGEEKLTRLVNANRALLDAYQLPVRIQARSSYTYAQIATFVGLLVLVLGVVITLAADETSARLGVAGLTAVGAAISGYIARTFLRVYERAQDQLNFYFREPLVTSYLLTAERLAEKLSDDRKEQAYADMVGEIVRTVRQDLAATRSSDSARGADALSPEPG